MQDHNASHQPQRSAHQRDEHRLRQHLAQDKPAARPQCHAQRRFLGTIRSSRRKQASQIGARSQQNEPGQHHEATHERARRPTKHVAYQPWTGERELHAFIVSRIGL